MAAPVPGEPGGNARSVLYTVLSVAYLANDRPSSASRLVTRPAPGLDLHVPASFGALETHLAV